MPGPRRRGAADRLAGAVRGVVVALALVMLVALALQVFMRFVVGQALSWSEELALGCFSWITLLSIALGVREAIHVRMDLLVDRLPDRLRQVVERLVAFSIAGVGTFVAWAGANYVVDSLGTTSAAIGYPIAWLYACAPVRGALVAVFALDRAIQGPFGTALGVPLAWLIGHSCTLTLQIGATMALLLIGVPICDVAARALNRKDPGNVIWDEIVTVPIVVMGLPPEQLDRPLVLLCAFALHRLFDISKLPPARQLEALPGGWGIMCDDVAAACYARGALQLIIVFLLR